MANNRELDRTAKTLTDAVADSMRRIAELGSLSATVATLVTPQALQLQKQLFGNERLRKNFAKEALGAWVELCAAQREQREHLRSIEARLFDGFTKVAKALASESTSKRKPAVKKKPAAKKKA